METVIPREIVVEIAKWARPAAFRAIMLLSKYYYTECKKLIPIWVKQWITVVKTEKSWAKIISGTGTVHGPVIYYLGEKRREIYYVEYGRVIAKFKYPRHNYKFVITTKKYKFKYKCGSNNQKIILGNIFNNNIYSLSFYYSDKYESNKYIPFGFDIDFIEGLYRSISNFELKDILEYDDLEQITLTINTYPAVHMYIYPKEKTISLNFLSCDYDEDSHPEEISYIDYTYKEMSKKTKDTIYRLICRDQELTELIELIIGPPDVEKLGYKMPEGIMRV